jgi:hypothetical protein
MLDLSPLEAGSLDRAAHGWNRMAYEVNPDGAGMTGGHCVTWKFYRPGQSLAVCVAYPYAAVHDIRICFAGGGWQVMHSEPADLVELGPATEGVDAIQADLGQDTNRRGYLLFVFLDASGELVPLDDLLDRDLWQRIKDRVAHPRGGRRREAAGLRTENLVQFQVFLEAYRPITRSERLEMQRLLQASVRELAHKTP